MWRITAIIMFAVLVGLSGFAGLWIADRDPPSAINRAIVLTPVVAPGEQLRIQYDIYRFRSCASHVDRTIYSGAARVRTPLEDLDFQSAPGPLGPDTFVAKVDIPLRIEPGMAVYRTAAMHVCNPLHRIWPVKTDPPEVHFEIRGPAIADELPIPIAPDRRR